MKVILSNLSKFHRKENLMENLHLKNLNRKDIIDDCIKLKEAADENNDEKIEYYRKIPEKTRYFNAEMNQI